MSVAKSMLGTMFGIIGAVIVCLIVLLVLIGGCTAMVGGCTKTVIDAETKRQEQKNATNQVVGGETNLVASPTTPKQDIKPQPKPKPEEQYADASQVVRQGNIAVKITKVNIDFVKLKTFEEGRSQDKLLMIWLDITNINQSKIMNYHGWGQEEMFSMDDRASLKDDVGNQYKRCNFGVMTKVVGQITGSESVYPNKSISDLLVFEPPIDACKFLLLELPAKNFGGDGMLRIRIPKEMWNGGSIGVVPQNISTPANNPKLDETSEWREWASLSGQYKVIAKLVEVDSNEVVRLVKKDGKRVAIPKNRLCMEDQDYIADILDVKKETK